MKLHRLGKSELDVSEVCLGTMTFGQQNSASEAHAQLDAATAHGVNFIDTAEMYPVPPRPETQGSTEAIVGDWLKKSGKRAKLIVATKIAGPRRPIHWVRDGKLSITRKNVQEAVNDSLKRLRTDYIDLYQIHWPDRYVPQFGTTQYEPGEETEATPILEQLSALDEVVKAGKVRYIGLSNETPWGVSNFVHTAETHGLPRPVSIQNAYHLLNRTYDGALAEVTRHDKVDLLAYSPLAFGFLSGKHLNGPHPGTRVSLFDGFAFRYRKQNVDEATQQYVKLAAEHGLTPVALALAFIRQRWFVRSTIIGATTLEQLDENLAAFNVTLSADVLSAIDAIHARFPSPAP